jgi:hypothetical protein
MGEGAVEANLLPIIILLSSSRHSLHVNKKIGPYYEMSNPILPIYKENLAIMTLVRGKPKNKI